VTDRIENYPGFPREIKGMDLSRAFELHAREMGLDVMFGNVKKVESGKTAKKLFLEDGTIEAGSLIIASGTEPRKLGVPGEDKLLGRGVSYCATCDAPFYKDKKVMVIGGGNSAVEEAIFLTNFASVVTIVHRRGELRADKILELRARNNPKIYMMWDSKVEKIEGKEKVESVAIKDNKTGKISKVEVDGVFLYVGYKPNVSFLNGLLKQDKGGYIVTDDELKTSVSGVFAAGDVRVKKLRQIVTAASDGALAASSAYRYLVGMKK